MENNKETKDGNHKRIPKRKPKVHKKGNQRWKPEAETKKGYQTENPKGHKKNTKKGNQKGNQNRKLKKNTKK